MKVRPVSARAVKFPPGYGSPGAEADLLPWSYVEEKLRASPNYWVSTTGPGLVPHARPVDGVWVDGALCFGGAGRARWVRNLHANPSLSVHLPSESEAIILEGEAEWVDDPSHPLAASSTEASREKYPQYFGEETAPFRPFWALRPRLAYCWTLEGFPRRATRWKFA